MIQTQPAALHTFIQSPQLLNSANENNLNPIQDPTCSRGGAELREPFGWSGGIKSSTRTAFLVAKRA